MTDYVLEYETALAAGTLAVGDLARIYDLSAKASRSATMADFRKMANSGTTDCTASTLTVTEALHSGHVVTLNRAAGIAVTLPAASGTGNRYRFVVGTTVTSNSTTIKVANASDAFQGFSIIVSDDTAAAKGFKATAGTDDTITFNGTTTGGYAGDEVEVIDVATNRFQVRVLGAATGVEATPFSATV